MASKREQVLQAMRALLATLPGPVVERNADRPTEASAAGRIIMRDGSRDEVDRTLGVPPSFWWEHKIEIEIYAQGDQAGRDAALDAVFTDLAAALAADPTLGGLVYTMSAADPEIVQETEDGVETIKAAMVRIVVEYETTSALN